MSAIIWRLVFLLVAVMLERFFFIYLSIGGVGLPLAVVGLVLVCWSWPPSRWWWIGGLAGLFFDLSGIGWLSGHVVFFGVFGWLMGVIVNGVTPGRRWWVVLGGGVAMVALLPWYELALAGNGDVAVRPLLQYCLVRVFMVVCLLSGPLWYSRNRHSQR